jgi:hypothetical protein
MSTLQCGNPRRLSLIAVFIGARNDCADIETAVLREFATRRICGEWLHVDAEEVVAAIHEEASK